MEKNKKTIIVYDTKGNENSKILLGNNILFFKENTHSVYRAVNVFLANKRQATAKTKTRSEVSGGGKKPWRQKGTGRARAGSIRSPLWVGGGIVFGPKGNQNFKLKQNSKEYKLAMCSALASKIKNNFLIVLNDIKVNKTKEIINILKTFKLQKTLIIVNKVDEKLSLSAENIPFIKLINIKNINVYDVINAKHLLVTLSAFEKIMNYFNLL